MRLLEKIAGLDKTDNKSISVDVSHVFKEEPGTTVFTFTEASTKHVFGSGKMSNWLKMQFPEWPDQLCETAAIMIVTMDKDALPEEDRKDANLALGHFIDRISLAEFTNFASQFFTTFPHLKDVEKEIDESKKN